ncbi:MAG: ROK family glucokinase [Bacillaceae bacterium]|nr:ROK family glucokinase [Bacillaceae bacterium]
MDHGSVYMGIDLGASSIKMGIVNRNGSLLESRRVPLREHEFHKVLNRFDQLALEILNTHDLSWEQVAGAGVGSPGFIDFQKGIVKDAGNLGWHHVPLKQELYRRWGIPIELDNDANAAALGESWIGAGQGVSDFLCLTIGTGIGSGIIIGGDIYHGAGGMAGEIGHIPVQPESGIRCNCGKTGCLETEASGTAIARIAVDRARRSSGGLLKQLYERDGNIKAGKVIELALQGDDACREIVGDTGKTLGRALSQICYILNPERIVIGGGISHAGDILFNPLKKAFRRTALPQLVETTAIVPARLGNRAGMIGAAYLVHRKKERNLC